MNIKRKKLLLKFWNTNRNAICESREEEWNSRKELSLTYPHEKSFPKFIAGQNFKDGKWKEIEGIEAFGSEIEALENTPRKKKQFIKRKVLPMLWKCTHPVNIHSKQYSDAGCVEATNPDSNVSNFNKSNTIVKLDKPNSNTLKRCLSVNSVKLDENPSIKMAKFDLGDVKSKFNTDSVEGIYSKDLKSCKDETDEKLKIRKMEITSDFEEFSKKKINASINILRDQVSPMLSNLKESTLTHCHLLRKCVATVEMLFQDFGKRDLNIKYDEEKDRKIEESNRSKRLKFKKRDCFCTENKPEKGKKTRKRKAEFLEENPNKCLSKEEVEEQIIKIAKFVCESAEQKSDICFEEMLIESNILNGDSEIKEVEADFGGSKIDNEEKVAETPNEPHSSDLDDPLEIITIVEENDSVVPCQKSQLNLLKEYLGWDSAGENFLDSSGITSSLNEGRDEGIVQTKISSEVEVLDVDEAATFLSIRDEKQEKLAHLGSKQKSPIHTLEMLGGNIANESSNAESGGNDPILSDSRNLENLERIEEIDSSSFEKGDILETGKDLPISSNSSKDAEPQISANSDIIIITLDDDEDDCQEINEIEKGEVLSRNATAIRSNSKDQESQTSPDGLKESCHTFIFDPVENNSNCSSAEEKNSKRTDLETVQVVEVRNSSPTSRLRQSLKRKKEMETMTEVVNDATQQCAGSEPRGKYFLIQLPELVVDEGKMKEMEINLERGKCLKRKDIATVDTSNPTDKNLNHLKSVDSINVLKANGAKIGKKRSNSNLFEKNQKLVVKLRRLETQTKEKSSDDDFMRDAQGSLRKSKAFDSHRADEYSSTDPVQENRIGDLESYGTATDQKLEEIMGVGENPVMNDFLEGEDQANLKTPKITSKLQVAPRLKIQSVYNLKSRKIFKSQECDFVTQTSITLNEVGSINITSEKSGLELIQEYSSSELEDEGEPPLELPESTNLEINNNLNKTEKLEASVEEKGICLGNIQEGINAKKRKRGRPKGRTSVLPNPCHGCENKCEHVSEHRRRYLNKEFWKLRSQDAMATFFNDIVKCKWDEEQRKVVCYYFINMNGLPRRVCLEFLLATFNVKMEVLKPHIKKSVEAGMQKFLEYVLNFN